MEEFDFEEPEEKPEKPKYKVTVDKLVDILESGIEDSTVREVRKNKIVEVLENSVDEDGQPLAMSTREICDAIAVNQTQGLTILKELKEEKRIGGVKPSGRWIWSLEKWVKDKLNR